MRARRDVPWFEARTPGDVGFIWSSLADTPLQGYGVFLTILAPLGEVH